MSQSGILLLDAPQAVADLLRRHPVPRTGAPVASSCGAFSYFVGRQASPLTILENLPAIVVDLTPDEPITYIEDGSVIERWIPVSVLVIVPSASADPSLDAAGQQAAAQAADADIKTCYADIEAVITAVRDQPVVGKHIDFAAQSPGVVADEAVAGSTGVRVRIAQLDLIVRAPASGAFGT